MTVKFNSKTVDLLDGKNFAVVATIDSSGGPQSSVVWVKRDGDSVVFSSIRDRQKVRNLARDQRVSLSIFDLQDPYDYVEIRGTAQLEDGGRELIDELANKYRGQDYPAEPEGTVRVVVRIVPEKVTGFSA